ncbi:MAG: nucleotidyltransferase family protein [Gemmatimonadetes bacterium]|nr:nucleotidyltransferase family protein [Gemmatimonadota bacterium]
MSARHLAPEARLLFDALRSVDDPRRRIRDLIEAGVDWSEFVKLGAREKLLPLMWRELAEHADALPSETMLTLRGLAAATEFSMATRDETLIEVVELLHGEGLDVLLLKGAALGKTVYSSFTLRPMGDLDLLLRRADAETAWATLRAAGWEREMEDGDASYEGHHHLPPLVDPARPTSIIELHHALVPPGVPFDIDTDALWGEASKVTLGSAGAWVPSPRWLLLHLSIHFAWSNQMRRGLGRTVRDVSKLLEVDPPDDDSFLELARSTRAATACYWTLRLSRSLGAGGVGDALLDGLRPRAPEPVLDRLHRFYLTAAIEGSVRSERLARLMWSTGIRPRASGHGSSRPWNEGEVFA